MAILWAAIFSGLSGYFVLGYFDCVQSPGLLDITKKDKINELEHIVESTSLLY